MLVIINPNYAELSKKAAQIVARELLKKPNLVLGLATGSTPIGLYRELIRMHREEGLDFSGVTTFNLDEYLGLARDNSQSFYYFIHKNFLSHINIDRNNMHIPDGSITENFEEYCRSYEEAIHAAGGIDLQILGIGRTGHIGFNEPTSSLASRTRIKTLSEITIRENQKTFGGSQPVPPCAITMGIGTILEAHRILLLAAGEHKAEAVAKAIEGPIASTITASALQLHPEVTVLLDESAASRLMFREYYDRVLQMTAKLTPEKVE